MNTLQTHFWAVRDYLAPVLRESKFKEHGRITPEEFVAAGDFLAYKFPTWSWSAASSSDSKYTREFLPANKQYLISRGVPCLRRVSQMERAALGKKTSVKSAESSTSTDEKILNFNEGHFGDEVSGKGGEDDWLATHLDEDSTVAHVADIEDIPDAEVPSGANSLTAVEEDDLAARVAKTSFGGTSAGQGSSGAEGVDKEGDMVDIGDIPDIADEEDEDDDELGGLGAGVVEADDPATLQSRQAAIGNASKSRSEHGNKLVSVRTYDCLITYDKYYQTPRMWLVGYNESGQPLKPSQIFEDISSDYAQKTVTVEPFPHGNMSTASIHPCKHASVMRKVIERMNAGVMAEQQKVKAAVSGGSENGSEKKKKKGWSLGGMKKSSGKNNIDAITPPTTSETGEEEATGAAATGASEIEVDGLRVDQYLLIFLKFMASIVPAIEIDATQAV